MPKYRIKDWAGFQHYKDRSPPWIRLHRSLLDNYEYHCLPDASKALAPFLWLLASENKDPSKGEIDASDEKISFRLHMQVKQFRDAVKALIERGFVEVDHVASELLATGKHAAVPETETETEEDKPYARGRGQRIRLEELSVDHLAEWLARKRAEGKYLQHDEYFIVDYFKNYCQSKGKKYADYIAGCRGAFEWDRCQPKAVAHGGASRSNYPTKADRAKDALVEGLLEYRSGNP